MLRKIEPLKHGPARWIQTIAANFFTRKFFPLKDDCLQPGVSAKRRAARSSGTATDDCNVKCFHFFQSRRNATRIKSFRRSQIVFILLGLRGWRIWRPIQE